MKYKKPNIFFEDKYIQIYKIAWLKTHDIACTESNFEEQFEKHSEYNFSSKEGEKPLQQFLDSPQVAEWNGKKVLGLFDFDSAFNQFKGLHGDRWDEVLGSPEVGLYRKRKNCKHFYAMVLPVPSHRKGYASLELKGESLLDIELYFTDVVLKKLSVSGEKIMPGGNPPILIFSGNKKEFWKKLFALEKNDFKSFNLIFERLTDLFNNEE